MKTRMGSRWLPWTVCAPLFAVACATFGGANYVSLDQEWQLGQELEADLRQRLDLVDGGTMQQYVNRVGQRMVRQTSMADRPWRFHVVRDPEINAFNVPGGLVYVHTGLLAEAGSAAEFAGALAHEIGHGLARHGTQRYSQQQEAGLLASILLGDNPGVVAQLGAQIAAAGAFANFSREDEREADEFAVPLMAATGYDPAGLEDLLRRLMQEGGTGGGFFATHPAPAERIEHVRDLRQDVNRSGLRMSDTDFQAAQRQARAMDR